MRRIICIFLLLGLLSVPAAALNVVTADYDKDKWAVESLFTEPVEGIPDGWIPLRRAAEHMPIDVSWDEEKREVVVVSHVRPYLRTSRYKADNMPLEFIIKDGVTYCHPQMIAYYLWDLGFMYDGEVYYIAEDSPDSKLIQGRGSAVFERKVLSTLLEIKLKLPKEYAFIRKHLTGGIRYVTRAEVPDSVSGAFGYIYSGAKRPVCHVVGDTQVRYVLAEIIAHEAHHVWEYRNGGVDEAAAYAYDDMVKNGLQGE